jgi:hypothetical protein
MSILPPGNPPASEPPPASGPWSTPPAAGPWPPPPASRPGGAPTGRGVREPGAIRVARWIAWVVFAGAVLQWSSTMIVLVRKNSAGDANLTGVLVLHALVGIVLAFPAWIAWNAVRAAAKRPRPGGYALLLALGPLGFAGSYALRAFTIDLVHDDTPGRAGLLLAVRLGAILYLVGLPLSAAFWLVPAARRYLARFRPVERSERGRKLLTAATVLFALTALLLPVVFAMFNLAPTTDVSRGDAGQVIVDFGKAAMIAVGALAGAISAFVLALLARRHRNATLRAGAWGIAAVDTLLHAGSIALAAVAVDTAANENAGLTAQVYTGIGLGVQILATLLHLIAIVMIAMPSVATWVDEPAP